MLVEEILLNSKSITPRQAITFAVNLLNKLGNTLLATNLSQKYESLPEPDKNNVKIVSRLIKQHIPQITYF